MQSCNTGTDGTTSTTTTCNVGTTTAGNALVGFYSVNGDVGADPAVISGCSNTYSAPETVVANGDSSIWFYAQNITGGACTVTVTTGSAHGYRTLIVHEVSGVLTSGALDVSVAQALASPGTGTNAATSGTDTTTAAGDYIFGAVHIANALSMTISPGTGFTGRTSGTGGVDTPPHRSEDLIQGAAGSIAATFTLPNNEPAHVGMIALKASGGGGGPTCNGGLLLRGVGGC